MVQGNATRACATHANAIHDQYNPWPMQLMTNPPHANAPPAEHHIIVAAVWRIFVKNMRVTR